MNGPPTPGLYARIMGAAFAALAPVVRNVHQCGDETQWVGRFQVRTCNSRVGRLLCGMMRLPSAGDAIATTLCIRPQARGEIWVRSFAGQVMTSRQFEARDCLLGEQVGIVELHFQLEAVEGSLVYRQVSAKLRLGPLALSLPRFLRPRVEAREEPDGPRRTRVSVSVTAPMIGLLISYEGYLEGESQP